MKFNMVLHKKTQRLLSLRYGIILKSHNDHLDPESFEEISPFASLKIFDLSLHSVTKAWKSVEVLQALSFSASFSNSKIFLSFLFSILWGQCFLK